MPLLAIGSVRWRKVWRDLLEHRVRSLLVVLSIAVGVAAVGTIAGANALLQRNLADGFAATRPSSASLFMTVPFDKSLVETVQRMPDIAEAEGRRSATARLVTGPDESVELQLTAIPDFTAQSMDLVAPEEGAWPPKRGEIWFERSSGSLADLEVGREVEIQLGPDKVRTLTTGGIAHEPGAAPAFFFGQVLAYVTFDTLADLGFDDSFDELRIRTTLEDPTRSGNRGIANAVKDRVEKAGSPVAFIQVPTPGEHPAQDVLNALFLILGAIGVLSLAVSGFLVINTISAILAQQTRQIGMMKAVGARDGQVAGVYFGIVLGYALIALLVALPVGALGAWLLTRFTAGLVNFEATEFFLPVEVLLLEIAIGLVVPMAAAAWPVWRGVRVTVREAISNAGIADGFGRSRFDRLIQGIKGPSRPTLLSIRNTFRRKARLVLTLAALTLGGAVFMSVFTLRASLVGTINETLDYFNYNVQVGLVTPARTSILVRTAEQVPGVVAAEPWTFANAQRVRPDDSTGSGQIVFGLPDGATTVRPRVEEGRFLVPGDGNALVVTRNFLDDEPDLRVGDSVTLTSKGRDVDFTLVGIVQAPTQRPFLYAPSTALETLTRDAGRAGILMTVAEQGDPAFERDTATALRDTLERAGFEVSATQTRSEIKDSINNLFNAMLLFVSVMALLLGVVGALGLAGTMTMNVVERSREIGVMRAIGARDRAVLAVFMVEGLLIGFLAWLVGVVISLPISKILSDALGESFVQRPLAYTPALDGIGYWLLAVAILALIASFLPAFRATRLAVREVLAYE
ncbi:MAG TPA: FtsX-like permease family protein [Candidatus Limnocylindrales bacterium]|nr:FtsX-like permease family protein [Candidatus Limnocylindrales bacterium]